MTAKEHNQKYLNGQDEKFSNLGMKIFCVMAVNEKNEVDVSMCEGVDKKALIEYFANAIKTLKYG